MVKILKLLKYIFCRIRILELANVSLYFCVFFANRLEIFLVCSQMETLVDVKKKKSPNWSINEVTTLLDLMIENNVMGLFDDKKTRTIDIYRMISEKLIDLGHNRDPDQIKVKFTKLKSDFMRIRINNNTSGAARLEDPFFEKMSTLLSKRPVIAFQETGFDTSQPQNLDEETTSTEVSEAEVRTDTSITEPSEIDPETDNDITPKSKRQRSSYRAVVTAVSEDLKHSMEEQTEKTLETLKAMQEEDKRFMKEMQNNDQQFLLALFNFTQSSENQVAFTTNELQ